MRKEIQHLLVNYPSLQQVSESIEGAFLKLVDVYKNNGKLLLCGNGGSAADCEHIAGELLKNNKIRRKLPKELSDNLKAVDAKEELISRLSGAFPAISLVSNVGYMTAFINDENPEYIYAQLLVSLGFKKDALLAISTSGNSVNIINAAIVAKAKGLTVIGLTGESGGKLKDYCDVVIRVPEKEVARIQEMHLPIYHTICEMLENEFFKEHSCKQEK